MFCCKGEQWIAASELSGCRPVALIVAFLRAFALICRKYGLLNG